MCTNGSRAARSTPAKARRTGKPSPSNPEGAVVTERTGRSAAVGSRSGTLGRATVSALIAGMTLLGAGRGEVSYLVQCPGYLCTQHPWCATASSMHQQAGRRLKRRQLRDRREHPWPVADRGLDPVEDVAGLEAKPPRPTEVICPTNRLCLERQCPPKPDREPSLLPSLDGEREGGRRRCGTTRDKGDEAVALGHDRLHLDLPRTLWQESQG